MLGSIKQLIGLEDKYLSPPLIPHSVLRSENAKEQLLKNGYYIADFATPFDITALRVLYEKYHSLKNSDGGMFITTFSNNRAYRRSIHEGVQQILRNSCNEWFHEYTNNINTFAVKTPGKSGYFVMHQDMAAIDEENYSLVNIWLPLQPITPLNGALCVVPQSHRLFSPYRCPTVKNILSDIQQELYAYAVPIYLEVGQALFFDPRIFHFSLPNNSSAERIVAQSRIYPKQADVRVYYKSGRDKMQLEVEAWACPEDYFIDSDAYCGDERPVNCTLLGYQTNPLPVTPRQFKEFSIRHNIKRQDLFDPIVVHQPDFIREPD